MLLYNAINFEGKNKQKAETYYHIKVSAFCEALAYPHRNL